MPFYVLFSSISVISGCCCDNERLCAMELHLQLERVLPKAGHELRTARSVAQCLTLLATGASNTVVSIWTAPIAEK